LSTSIPNDGRHRDRTAATRDGIDPDPRGHYGVIYRRTWTRPDFKALSFNARAVYVYLRTAPTGSLLGILRVHPADIEDDLGLAADLAARALDELERTGWIQREERWLLINDAFATTPGIVLRNPNHHATIRRALAQVPNTLATEWKRLNRFEPRDPISDQIGDPIGEPIPDGNGEPMGDHGYVNGDGNGNGYDGPQ
jgi:hypothetical protein